MGMFAAVTEDAHHTKVRFFLISRQEVDDRAPVRDFDEVLYE